MEYFLKTKKYKLLVELLTNNGRLKINNCILLYIILINLLFNYVIFKQFVLLKKVLIFYNYFKIRAIIIAIRL